MTTTPGFTTHSFGGLQLSVPATQAGHTPGYNAAWVKTPSSNTPAYGGIFLVDLRPNNVRYTDAFLELSLSSLTGLTVSASGTAAYVPLYWFFSKIEVLMNGVLVQTVYPTSSFLRTQMFAGNDESRTFLNNLTGNFASHAARATASASTSNWYLPLSKTFLCQAGVKFTQGAQIQLRFTMDSLSNLYSLTSGSTATGTPASTIYSATVYTQEERLSEADLSYTAAIMRKAPVSYLYNSSLWQQNVLGSGITSASITLNSIVGSVSHLIIALRPGSSVSGSGFYTFDSSLSSYEILNAASQNITGGQPILSFVGTQLLPMKWGATTGFLNTVQSGVYLYSFAYDANESDNTATHTGSRHFTGAEVLKLYFTASTSTAITIDIFAVQNMALTISGQQVKTSALPS